MNIWTMSDSQGEPWSDNPNAPRIPYQVYFREKTSFAGSLIGAILYGTPKTPYLHICLSALILFVWFVLGMVILLFFKCMAALFNPVHRKGEGVKWELVSYTVIMFSFVTVLTAADLEILSISYIDNREFPGIEGVIPPGPLGYEWLISPDALGIVPHVMFILCTWLADGLLVGSLFDSAFAHQGV